MLKQPTQLFVVEPSESHAGTIRHAGAVEGSYHNLTTQAAAHVHVPEGATLKQQDAMLTRATRNALKAKVTSRTPKNARVIAVSCTLDIILPMLKRVCPEVSPRADRRPWNYVF